RPIQFVEKDWAHADWIEGGISTRPPGLMTQYTDAVTTPVGRVHWAGTEAASVAYDGYMDGAVVAAERAVTEVLEALRENDAASFEQRSLAAATLRSVGL